MEVLILIIVVCIVLEYFLGSNASSNNSSSSSLNSNNSPSDSTPPQNRISESESESESETVLPTDIQKKINILASYKNYPLFSEKERELNKIIDDLNFYKKIATKDSECNFINELDSLLLDIQNFKNSLIKIGNPERISNWSDLHFLFFEAKKERLHAKFEKLNIVKRKRIVSKILEKYGTGTINHMAHVSNLGGILTKISPNEKSSSKGGLSLLGNIFPKVYQNYLFSHNYQFSHTDISNQGVNARRNHKEPIYGHQIHDYVPFYFNIKNAMLYTVQKQHGDNIIILGFSTNILDEEKVLFSNKNAATNSVSFTQSGDELLNKNFIDFDVVFTAENWGGDTILKQKMQAEILIYDKVSTLFNLKYIYVQNENVKQYIEVLYKEQLSIKGIWGAPEVIVKPDLFF